MIEQLVVLKFFYKKKKFVYKIDQICLLCELNCFDFI